MYTCPNCNKTTETQTNFCSACGSKMVYVEPAPVVDPAPVAELTPTVENVPAVESAPAAEPVPEMPTYQPPVYQVPTYQAVSYAPQEEKKPVHLAKKIVGMALSIGGLVFAVIGALYTLIFLIGAEEMGIASFVFSLVFSIFSAPLSIVGLVMSNNNIACGDTSTMSQVGKRIGIAAIIVTGVMLFFGIIGVAAYDPYYYY